MQIQFEEVKFTSPQAMRADYLERRKRLNQGMPKAAKPVVIAPLPAPEPKPEPVVVEPQEPVTYSDELVRVVARLINDGKSADEISAQIGASVEVIKAAAEFMLERTSEAHSKLAEFMGPVERKQTLEDIMRSVCRKFKITRLELKDQRRAAYHVLAHQFFFYKCKQLTTRSYPEIGRFCGDRDHTTVLHGVRKIEGYIRDGVLNDDGDILKIPSGMKNKMALSSAEHILKCPDELRRIFADLKAKGKA
jgi:DNA-binding FrmR family transcriptional regulator